FMLVGLVERRTGTRDLRELSGLARAMPWDKAMLVVASLSMAGVLPTLGFASKELLIDAFVHGPGDPVVVVVTTAAVVLSAVLTVAYSARVVVATMFGPPVPLLSRWRDSAPMSVAIAVSAVAGLVLGPGVALLEPVVAPAVMAVAGIEAGDVPSLSLWHGVNLALVLSTVAIVLGVLLVTAGRHVLERVLVHRQLLPWTGSDTVQAVHDAIIAIGRRTGDLTRSDVPARQLAVPVVLLGCATIAPLWLWRGLPPSATGAVAPIDVGLLALLLLGVVAVLTARARLTAVLGAGTAGFGVVLWFLVLGASDVALTQLLVEVLTVAAMVLVLPRMSRLFSRTGRRRRSAAAATAAVAAGVAATGATLVFTGHRSLSEVGRYFQIHAQDDTGGTNVVNTILVDYRALDTLGELVVLAIGAVAISALLDARRLVERPGQVMSGPLRDPERNSRFLTTADRALIPVMIAISVYLLLRGHNAPGGGFIAALVGASALVLAYLASATDEVPRVQRPYLTIAAVGVLVAVGTGVLGLFDGSFLRPLHAEILGVKLTTALIFDVGVYLAVLGMMLSAVVRVGTTGREAVRR
uniref:hydrogen gas-evolving membrane-bound hydrogenase subunit E n=1 Tax=Pseudactinotalea sp. TaxID=1926260 RepID=UPI003B3B2268